MRIEYKRGKRESFETTGSLTEEFVADRVKNKSIDGVTTHGNQSRISFGLSGGGILRFQPKVGGAEIIYVPPIGE